MAIPFDTPGAVAAIMTLVGGIDGVRHVARGAPKSNTYDLQAWVVVTAAQYIDKTTGNVIRRIQRVMVVFGYRTGGDADAAEGALMATNDLFPRAIYSNRTLSGKVGNLTIDGSASGTAVYAEYANQEFRVFPQELVFEQQEVVPEAA